MNATHDINDSLKANYMLIVLSISRWNASKRDDALAAEAAGLHGATPDAVRATKKIMAGADSELRAVEKALNAIRTYAYSVTLPWAGNDEGAKRGPRLIPTASSLEFITEMSKLEGEFKQALTDFKAVYATRVAQAMNNQGSLADASLYPDVADLDSMFSVRMDMEPVPTVADFSRMSLPAKVAEALGSRMGKRQSKVVENAMADLTRRITDAVGNMAKQLSKHVAGEKTRLYASLVDNVKTLLGLLKSANLTDDPELNELASMMDALVVHDIKALKDNHGAAKDVAAKAEAIVQQLNKGKSEPEPAPEPVMEMGTQKIPEPEPERGLETQPQRAITKPEPAMPDTPIVVGDGDVEWY